MIFFVSYWCPFWFYNHLDGEERADCFAFIVFLVFLTVYVLWFFYTVPCVGLQCVIADLTYHTHLLFYSIMKIISYTSLLT